MSIAEVSSRAIKPTDPRTLDRLPLDVARKIAIEQGIASDVFPLFQNQIEPFLFASNNRAGTKQLVDSFNDRRAQLPLTMLPGESREAFEERRRKSDALETLVARLETGLGGPQPATRVAAAPVAASASDDASGVSKPRMDPGELEDGSPRARRRIKVAPQPRTTGDKPPTPRPSPSQLYSVLPPPQFGQYGGKHPRSTPTLKIRLISPPGARPLFPQSRRSRFHQQVSKRLNSSSSTTTRRRTVRDSTNRRQPSTSAMPSPRPALSLRASTRKSSARSPSPDVTLSLSSTTRLASPFRP